MFGDLGYYNWSSEDMRLYKALRGSDSISLRFLTRRGITKSQFWSHINFFGNFILFSGIAISTHIPANILTNICYLLKLSLKKNNNISIKEKSNYQSNEQSSMKKPFKHYLYEI